MGSALRVHDVDGAICSPFAGFPNFCPIVFHLFCSYSLMAARRAALCVGLLVRVHKYCGRRDQPRFRQIRRSAYPYASISDMFGPLDKLPYTDLVPMLLHTAFGPRRKRLCIVSLIFPISRLFLGLWQFHSNSSLRPSSASTFALPLASMVYLSDPFSRAVEHSVAAQG